MARLKLQVWDGVIQDCQDCLSLTPNNMKGHFYLSQAQLGIADYDAALESALKAHSLCVSTDDVKSLPAVTNIVLQVKKARWEDKEKRRVREAKDLEREVLEMLGRERDEMLMSCEDEVERNVITEESEQKISRMADIFERARAASEKRREVPDWAIDDISFGIMVDPVVVSTPPIALRNLEQTTPANTHALRRRPESHTNGPPSWSTSVGIPAIP